MRGMSSATMPSPVSATRTVTAPPARQAETSTRPPAGVYLTALSSRFPSTWRIRSASAVTGSRSMGATASSTPFSSATYW